MILPVTYNFILQKSVNKIQNKKSETKAPCRTMIGYDAYNTYASNLNKLSISFRGYDGDMQPATRLLYCLTGRDYLFEDEWTKNNLTNEAGYKKWVDAYPDFLLKRTPEQALQSIGTIIKCGKRFPYPAVSPDYGDKWGRHANYIEINPRITARFEKDKYGDFYNADEGLLGVIKLLPAIPPSADKFANCLILSELFKTNDEDGKSGRSSLYGVNFNCGISKTLLSPSISQKMKPEEQVKAFNDLAHMMGFKTGFRTLLSDGQMWVRGEQFDWNNPYHENIFIDECVKAIDMGFDCIYFDSAKHIIDNEGAMYLGKLPDKDKMAYITSEIRARSGRNDLSFVGEQCNSNPVYKEMGLTAGTGLGFPQSKELYKYETDNQSWNDSYAAGFEVTNDNYGREGSDRISLGKRLYRVYMCVDGFENSENKLPSFMQLDDMFPLSPYTSTHELMENIKKMDSNALTNCEQHWEGVFDSSYDAVKHRNSVNAFFKNAMYK